MSDIVQVIDKPANLIDVLRSERAKEARRLSDELASASLITLAGAVAAAEVLVEAPEFKALAGVLEAALAPASVAEIKRELGLLFAVERVGALRQPRSWLRKRRSRETGLDVRERCGEGKNRPPQTLATLAGTNREVR
jgi:hypothetical protein